MDGQFLKIRIARVQAGKTFRCALYLNMPRNGKMICIAAVGDDLRPELLERLVGRGVTELFVTPGQGDNLDPEKFELYRITELSEAAAPAASSGPEFIPIEKKASADAAPGLLEEGTKVAGADFDDASSTKIKNRPEQAPETQTVGGSPENSPEGSVLVKGSKDALAEDLSKISPLKDESSHTAVKFKHGSGEEGALVVKGTAGAAEEISVISGPASKQEETEYRFSTKESFKETPVKRSPEAIKDSPLEASKNESVLQSPATPGDPEAPSEKSKHAASPDHAEGSASIDLKHSTDKFSEAAAAVKALKEGATSPEAFAKAKSLLADAKKAFQAQATAHTSSAIQIFERSFADISEQFQAAFNEAAKRTAENITPSPLNSEEMEVEGKTFGTAKHTSGTSQEFESPQTIALLAAYLGHSLGYAKLEFLAELGLASILRLHKKQNFHFETAAVSKFTAALVQQESRDPDSVYEDAIEVIGFLERYSQDPGFDPRARLFSKKAFSSTKERVNAVTSETNPWNQARWEQFVARGPTVDAARICSQASAMALKKSHEISDNN